VAIQKPGFEKNTTKKMAALIRGSVLFPAVIAIFSILSNTASYAQSPRTKGPADTSKVVVTEEYWNSEKKSALFDSSGRQLSTQQMVDFLKNELKKLNEQITTLVQRASPDSSKSTTASDVDVMKLFIIKGKLESMEKTLDEWISQRDLEQNASGRAPAASPPKVK
jgi:hypothetical protein